MATTANFGWDIGFKGKNPWWETWDTLWDEVDAHLYFPGFPEDVTPVAGDFLVTAASEKVTIGNLFRNLPDGTAAAPSLAFGSDQNNGMYLADVDHIGFATAGVMRFSIEGQLPRSDINFRNCTVQYGTTTDSVNLVIIGEDAFYTPFQIYKTTTLTAYFTNTGSLILNCNNLASEAFAIYRSGDANPYFKISDYGIINWGAGGANSVDVNISREAALILGLNSALSFAEITAPAGAANKARIYAQDNGAGKTQLMVIFPTGVAQQLAIEA